MSNHQSVFDIPALVAVLPVSWRFVAKKELVWIPIFGWALWLAGHAEDREMLKARVRDAIYEGLDPDLQRLPKPCDGSDGSG